MSCTFERDSPAMIRHLVEASVRRWRWRSVEARYLSLNCSNGSQNGAQDTPRRNFSYAGVSRGVLGVSSGGPEGAPHTSRPNFSYVVMSGGDLGVSSGDLLQRPLMVDTAGTKCGPTNGPVQGGLGIPPHIILGAAGESEKSFADNLNGERQVQSLSSRTVWADAEAQSESSYEGSGFIPDELDHITLFSNVAPTVLASLAAKVDGDQSHSQSRQCDEGFVAIVQALLDKYAPGDDPTGNRMLRLKQVCGQLLGKRSESSELLPSPYSQPIIQSSSCIPGTNKDNLRRAQGKRAKGRSSR